MIRIGLALIIALAIFAAADADKKKACGSAKASIANSKRSTIISSGDLNLDVSALAKGVRRRRGASSASVAEQDEDCDNAKKSSVEIKQSAASALPGKNVEAIIENEKKSKVIISDKEINHEYLMLPGKEEAGSSINAPVVERKDKLEKPSNNKKHSPLWSLSRLIENSAVDMTGSKKATVVVKPLPTKVGKASTKSNLMDPSTAIKATLSKAIEKVEKVIAVKNAKEITPAKAAVRSPSKPTSSSSSWSSTTAGQTKASGNNLTNTTNTGSGKSTTTSNGGSASSSANKSSSSSAAPQKSAEKTTIDDPYAEIAMGPDRPKIPELKSDAGDASPVMKMSGGEMKPVNSMSADPAARNAKPLGGEHDVGGLLDRLTDKLNSGGGGVAMETSPLASDTNDVKYVQNSVSSDEGNFKQEQEFAVDKLKDQADMSDMQKMTENAGLFSGGNDNSQQSLLGGAAGAGAGSESSSLSSPASSASQTTPTDDLAATLEKAQAASQSPSSSGSSGSNDDLIASLEKANAAATSSSPTETMPQSTGSSDATAAALSGATSVGGETSSEDAISKSLSKASSMSTDSVMDLLKSGKVSGTDFSNAEVSPGPDPYENTAESQQSTASTDESLGSLLAQGGGASKEIESNDDLAGGLAGSLDSSNSQLIGGGLEGGEQQMTDSSSLQGVSDSDALSQAPTSAEAGDPGEEAYQRSSIPADEREDSFRRHYNTEIFKKHTIMRPKRDTYVSPFLTKEAFDTAI